MITELENALVRNRPNFHSVIDFDPATQKLFQFNFTDSNTELTAIEIADTKLFSEYINRKLKLTGAKYGIGGYKENRKLYRRSEMFERGRSKIHSPRYRCVGASQYTCVCCIGRNGTQFRL